MDLLLNIGGTKTEALISQSAAPLIVATTDFETTEALLRHVIAQTAKPKRVFLAVAGPVADGKATLTNGVLRFDEAAIQSAFELDAAVLTNDAVAGAWSLLQEMSSTNEAALFLSIGTGLGTALLLSNVPHVLPLEGGRVPVRAPALLLEYPQFRELEDILSGKGLTDLTNALTKRSFGTGAEVFAKADAPDIDAALEIFWDILAAYCADMALLIPSLSRIALGGSVILKNQGAVARADLPRRIAQDHVTIHPVSAMTPELDGLKILAEKTV